MFWPRVLTSLITIFVCFATFASVATRLPTDEVEALKQIGKTLGKTNWDFSVDPCSGESGWVTNTTTAAGHYQNNVTCNCSFSLNTTCHIVSIVLKVQNLSGTLPPELVRLPYLQKIDLTFNYLNGTIPPEWGSMQLITISFFGNRLTGSLPKELGNITTLAELTVALNQFSGAIPPELGNLPHIEKLHLFSNNFTEELPGTLANLTTLKDFWIADNNFTGKIPNFIQKWTSIQRLVISGLEGPIPSGIQVLENMTDLRITDLNGPEGTFPPLSKMKNLKSLILRSCNITGELPDYLGNMNNLKRLDLSFNQLSGKIPRNFLGLSNIDFMYLTKNLLNGTVPEWILESQKNIDLSYNNMNLTHGSSSVICPQQSLNLFGSSSERDNTIPPCLSSYGCSRNSYSFHINCGGSEISVGNITYEDDTYSGGPSNLFRSRTNWVLSSTGDFLDDGQNRDNYTYTTTARLSMKDPELYMNARLSPLSLTYYGVCLLNTSYIVKLHFAEIMFTDDRTYRSFGRRIFDVYIQGKLVLKDFNIEYEAGGVGKVIIKTFTAVVTNGTLEIRFYWAGKGSIAIPSLGVYGPLISAISVDPVAENGNSVSAGTIVGVVAAVVCIIFLVLAVLWWKGCLKCEDTVEQDLKGLDLQTGSFTLRQIKAATNNFDAAYKIGEGGFGPVYKGLLSDGTIIAVKQLSSKSKQGNREFVNEIGMISALQHPHLVNLYGCCIEGNQLLLVYEYMENNSLARALFGPEECQLKLDWPTRHLICIGIARGLAYLHGESRLKIVHRDIKATNVLLDKNLSPKISDFGLAKLDDEENTHISTRIAGTFGYMAPEYAMWGYLTDKADVYSFGIVALEIVSGRSTTNCKPTGDCFSLLQWALALKKQGNLLELVDPKLGSDYDKEEVMVMINVALLCTNVTAAVRPTMSSVLSMLEGKAVVQDLVLESQVSFGEIELNEKWNQPKDSQVRSTLTWTASTSATDLYPILGSSSTSATDLYPILGSASTSATELYPILGSK